VQRRLINVMQQRREPFSFPLPCGLSHTLQSLGHACPDLRPARVGLDRVARGRPPWLHPLRTRFSGAVRRLRSYYGAARLLRLVHHRLRLVAFPTRTAAMGAGRGGGANRRVASHPLESAAFARRTPFPAIHRTSMEPPSETFLAAHRIAGLPGKRSSAPDWDMPTRVHLNSLRSPFASFRSAVSKPSVNQP
jgi:hypothetical protein